LRSLALVCLLATDAHADRPLHGSVAAGGTLVLAGSDGDRLRNEISADIKPWSRYGVIASWRAFDEASLGDGTHDGMLTAGIVFEAGAARPRLVLDLVGEVGWDLDQDAPLAGAGIRNTIGVIGPLAVVLQSSLYLVIDGDDTRVHVQGNALVGLRF
jgi:hypothetical protein